MSVLRRSALLLTIAVTTLVGLTANPAQAAFTDKTLPATVTVGTVTVAAPGNLTARMTSCGYGGGYYGGTQRVQLTWTASPTSRVSGYRITVFNRSGSTVTSAEGGPTATSAVVTINDYDASTLTFSVTTLTDYGWTAASPRKAPLPC